MEWDFKQNKPVERPDNVDGTGMYRISGTVEGIIFASDETGYAVFDVDAGGDLGMVTAVGTIPYLNEGDSVTLYGRWVTNPKYGRQFRAEQFEKHLPSDAASVLRYLSSGAVRGVGPKTAQKIVDKFGEGAFDVIENHPDWLVEAGISRKRAYDIAEDFREKAGMRNTIMFFREFFGPALTVKIYRRFGSGAVELARKNPYILCEEIEGIGFDKADAMAQKLGCAGGRDRVLSGMLYLLRANASQNGHVCLPREKLTETAVSALGISKEEADIAVGELTGSHKIKAVRYGDECYLYTTAAYEAERYIADKLVLLDRMCPVTDNNDVFGFIAREEAEHGMEYAELQKRAIYDALRSGVFLLSGGPGTGKTTVVRALLHIFRAMDFKVALAAPTGRAAKRLSESTSTEARTVHRLLEMEYGDGSDEKRRTGDTERHFNFRRNEQNLLDEDVIIIDEASMVDNALMASLLRAVKPGARCIFIGDADQLPSVGAGNVLCDLIASGRFSTVLLTEIFRQAQKSLIVTNAHAVNEGRMPNLTAKDRDFFFIPRGSDREIAATVADLMATRLPRAYGELAETGTQVITPSRKGEAGTEALNLLLQARLNPPARGKAEFKFREQTFREGDRVMQMRNNYEIEWTRDSGDTGSGVFNGDIGYIASIRPEQKSMEVRFDDRTVEYAAEQAEDLEHAWAVTVHKSQGCEYPIVIIPAYAAPPMLLTRNPLYTAVTRAEQMVVVVGREDIVRTMVENNRQSLRYTGLARRLCKDGTEGSV